MRKYKLKIIRKLLVSLLFISSMAFAQKVDIQRIQLEDSTLIQGIKTFIANTIISKPIFNNEGYIEVRMIFIDEKRKYKKLKSQYKIKDQYASLKSSSIYPSYYTYINDKLVLFYSSLDFLKNNLHFSNRSKNRLLKKISPYLTKNEHIIAKDENGNIIIDDKNFRDEKYNIHGGSLLNIYNNGDFEIIEQ